MTDGNNSAKELEKKIKALAEAEGVTPAELFRRRLRSLARHVTGSNTTIDLTDELNAEIEAMARREGLTKREVFERGLKLFGVDPNDPKIK